MHSGYGPEALKNLALNEYLNCEDRYIFLTKK